MQFWFINSLIFVADRNGKELTKPLFFQSVKLANIVSGMRWYNFKKSDKEAMKLVNLVCSKGFCFGGMGFFRLGMDSFKEVSLS